MTTRRESSDTSRSWSAGELAAAESGHNAASPFEPEPRSGDAGAAARDGRVLVFRGPAPGEAGWLIRDTVDRQVLVDAVGEYLDLLETSAAVHEKNGESVLAIFASDWCRLLSGAAQDGGPADADCSPACERRVCRESSWQKAAQVAIETGQPTDLACDGGIRLYAVPIRAGSETVGALSFGHGVPPREAAQLEALAARYLVPVETLRQYAEAYEPRPPAIVELAKRRLHVSARLLGEIIERRRAENRLQAANRMLRMISECNQSLVRAVSEAELLEATCRHIVERGGYPLAWVGWADDSSSDGPLQLAAHVGGEAAFLDAACTQCCSLAQGQGLAGAALRTGRPAVLADLRADSVAPACRQHALQNGYASAIALPLLSEGRALGVLMIHAAAPDAFHADEIDLLTELANDLAYGVVALRTRASRDRAEAEREKMSRQRQLALDAANMGWWHYDPATGVVAWNERYAEIFGVAGRARPHDEILRLLHSEDQPRVRAAVEAALNPRDPQPFATEYRVKRGDGQQRWIEAHGLAEFAGEGSGRRAIRFLGTVADITERKQAEEALRQSEERLQFALETVRAGAWDLDLIDHTAYRSLEHDRIFGYAELRPEWTYEMFLQHVLPEDRADVDARFQQAVASQSDWSFECRIRRTDGQQRWIWAAGRHRRDGSGRWRRMSGIVQDISERKQAEQAVRESEQRLRLALDAAHMGTFDWDVPGHRIIWSRWHEELLGFAPGEFPGTYDAFAARVHPEDLPGLQAAVDHCLAAHNRYVHEFRVVHPDGSIRWISGTGEFEFDAAGRPLHMRGTVADATERKRFEHEKEDLEAQLRQAQKLEAVGRLAGGVAHDFNNGLSVILGYGELALEETLPDTPLRGYLQEILTAVQRSTGIARQLLAFARRQVISPKVLDLNESIEGTLKMLRRLMGEDIDLVWRPGAGLGPVLMDPSQLDQILTNLCVNARDAIADVGQLSIQTENVVLDEAACAGSADAVPGEYAVLAVSDNGCGMTPDILDRIYEPFFTTKGLGKGTGLGLPTVYGIAKQNRGFVRVSSEPGRGTTFQIYLPRQSHPFEAAAPDPSPQVARGRGETVLVVEDDLRILDLVETALTNLGYLVLTAATPGDAVRLAQRFGSRIDLLMTDIVMPEMNGRELAERLAALQPQLKRLFISGYTADVIAERGVLEAGVHLLHKPFSSHELAAKIRAVLDE